METKQTKSVSIFKSKNFERDFKELKKMAKEIRDYTTQERKNNQSITNDYR